MFEPFEERRKKVTAAFDLFLEEFIIKGNSILTDLNFGKELKLRDSISEFYKKYVHNPLEELSGEDKKKGKTVFESKLEKQFTNADNPDSVKLLLAHILWIWSLADADRTPNAKVKQVTDTFELDFGTKVVSSFNVKESKHDMTLLYPEGIASHGQYHKTHKYFEVLYIFLLIKLFRELQECQKDENNVWADKQSVKKAIEIISEFVLYEKVEDTDKLINDINSNVEVFEDNKSLNKSEEDLIKLFLSHWLENDKEKADKPSYKNGIKDSISMCNILMYLSNPEEHEPIVSNNHKEAICDTFKFLSDDIEQSDNYEKKIQKIKKALKTIGYTFSSFYDIDEMKLLPLWNPGSYDKSFEAYEALMYKKAIVLYGPPGTSKTYSANQIARSVCLHQDFNSINDDADKKEWLKKHLQSPKSEIYKDQITNLQLHANYTYQDFIGGLQIKKEKTQAVKGDFYRIIDEAKENREKPYVLILDEINRTDLSAMFGEVFSALENRNKEVTVSVPFDEEETDAHLKKLKVPENLYVIGTMNQIDFSLEKLDFAMRRRFLWFFHGYEEQRLRDILNFKLKKDWFNETGNNEGDGKESDGESTNKHGDELSTFVDRATKLNEAIEKEDLLGPDYVIGHTFFAEILDIQKQFKESRSSGNQTYDIYKKAGPADILWNISIKPMIEAFLGALDPKTKKDKVDGFNKVYNPNSSD